MAVIIQAFGSLINGFLTVFKFIFWLFDGLQMMAAMMFTSISALGNILGFLPHAVASAIVAMCGGLVVLRIFGRS